MQLGAAQSPPADFQTSFMPSSVQKLHSKIRVLASMMGRGEGKVSPAVVLGDMLRKRMRAVRLEAEARLVHGPRHLPTTPSDVVALCSLRDGEPFIPHFLRHHRQLGVRHFVFLDNGSRDGTIALLRRESDVTIYSSELPYGSYKHLFKRFLIRQLGRGKWSLLLDIDECFDFPGSDHVDLPGFCRYLDAHGYNAVAAHMLDLFHCGPVLEPPAAPDGDLARVFDHYDLSNIKEDDHLSAFGPSNTVSNPEIKCLSCGINHTVFGNDVLLTKHPLIRWAPPLELPKFSHDIGYARIADVSAVLYHFKFTAAFRQVVERALHEKNYFNGSERYRRISELLERKPRLSLRTRTARRLESVRDLVDAGFLHASPEFARWSDGTHTVLPDGTCTQST